MSSSDWIIDDDSSSLRAFSRIVRSLGHRPEVFDGGTAAVEAARESRPDLVLLDVMMPEPDGFESCRLLRRQFGDEMIPIVMITARYERDLYVKGIEAGADDYLVQPVPQEELESRLSALLKQRERYREAVRRLREQIEHRDQQLFMADRLATIGLLAAGITHEFNHLFTGVVYNLERCLRLLEEPETDDDGRREKAVQALERALGQVPAVSQFLDGLRAFSQVDEPDDNADLAEVIDSVRRVAAHVVRRRADLVPEIDGHPRAAISAPRLAQVVLNLLVNAAHAVEETGEFGRITVRAAEGPGDTALLEVEDTGPGVREEVRDRVFEPFFTTKGTGRGTGLGLSIVRDLVERAGGRVTLEPGQEGGTVARVVLPAGGRIQRPRSAIRNT